MTPAYLPFTTLGEAAAKAVFRYFKNLTLYRPQEAPLPEHLKPWLEAGRLDLRVPVGDDDGRLAQALAACQQWARERGLGDGEAGAFLKAQPKGAPLYDEDAVGRLRHQILAGGAPEAPGAADPLFDARLFLAMAEAYDGDNDNAALQLEKLQAVEEAVLREMHAGTQAGAKIGPPTAAIAAGEDRGAFMPGERLRAWAILAARDVDFAPLLVTDSPTAAAELLEYRSGGLLAAPTLTLQLPPQGDGDTPILQERLLTWLERVVMAEAPGPRFTSDAAGVPVGTADAPGIILHLLTDCPCARLIRGLLPPGAAPRWRSRDDGARNGVLALIRA